MSEEKKAEREKDPRELINKHQEQYFRKLKNRQISVTEIKLGVSELEKGNIALTEGRKHISFLSVSLK